jgi:hypothetical protein
MTKHSKDDRRDFLALGGASMLAALGLPFSPAASATSNSPGSYDGRLAALRAVGTSADLFTKMRADLGGGTVAYLTRGLIYAYLSEASAPLPVPLMGAEGLTFTRHERIADGWRQLMHEVVYYTDFETHAVLGGLKNPVTGRLVQARHYRERQTLDFVADEIRLPDRPAGFETRTRFAGPFLQGGSVFMHEHIMSREPPPPTGGPLRRIDSVLAVYASPLEELLDPSRRSARCTCQFGIVGRFPAWLKMDDVPGRVVWAGHSTKLAGLDEVTPWLADRITRDHPDYLRQPQV